MSFVSINAPNNPVSLMYENKTVESHSLILSLIIRCALCSKNTVLFFSNCGP